MLVGGLYPRGVRAKDIKLGVIDEYSFNAYERLVQRTLMRQQAGQQVTLKDVLDEAFRSGAGVAQGVLEGPNGPKLIRLADPAAVSEVLDNAAQQTLGRKATQDEERLFIAAFHQMQRREQYADSGEVVSPDAGAQAKQFLTQNNANEAAGYNLVQQFNNFAQIMGGR
jgi:hypothetical protein